MKIIRRFEMLNNLWWYEMLIVWINKPRPGFPTVPEENNYNKSPKLKPLCIDCVLIGFPLSIHETIQRRNITAFSRINRYILLSLISVDALCFGRVKKKHVFNYLPTRASSWGSNSRWYWFKYAFSSSVPRTW